MTDILSHKQFLVSAHVGFRACDRFTDSGYSHLPSVCSLLKFDSHLIVYMSIICVYVKLISLYNIAAWTECICIYNNVFSNFAEYRYTYWRIILLLYAASKSSIIIQMSVDNFPWVLTLGYYWDIYISFDGGMFSGWHQSIIFLQYEIHANSVHSGQILLDCIGIQPSCYISMD